MTSTTQLTWNADADLNGTSLQDYLMKGEWPWSFEETVARLITASGQNPPANDGYKVSVEFIGTFNGKVFTLYDYKEDRELHIGAHNQDDIRGLTAAVRDALSAVEPSPYEAREYYDKERGHRWWPAPNAKPVTKHTPGPWTIERVQGIHEKYPSVVGFRVAGAFYREYRDAVEANARLIAAAPELLALVRRSLDNGAYGHVAGLTTEVRALLARIDEDQS
jgi:hypothetical protein